MIIMASQSSQSACQYSFLTHTQVNISGNNNFSNLYPTMTTTISTTSANSGINVMDTMTLAMKLYKNILFHIESQYKNLGVESISQLRFANTQSNLEGYNQSQQKIQILNNSIKNQTTPSSPSFSHFHYHKLQQMLVSLLKSATQIQQTNHKKILSNRLANRFLQITTLYRNKCAQNQATIQFKDHLGVIMGLIREYQSGNMNNNWTNNNSNYNSYVYLYVGSSCVNSNTGYSIELVVLFDRICWVFKKCLRQLRQKVIRILQKSQIQSQTSINSKNVSIISNIILKSLPTKDKEKQKQKKFNSICTLSQVPTKSLQYKYKITKQVLANTNLFAGMDIDISHLRGLFYQVRNNITDLQQQKIQANSLSIKCRDQYISQYNEYKIKLKKKMQKKLADKTLKVSQSSPIKNRQNKLTITQKNTNIMFNKTSKMPKILQTTQINSDQSCRNSREKDKQRDRLQFKNIQALNFNRQFIHLSQIKNQKIAKRPYAQVKQVLVAGDQLNYYSNKVNSVQGNNSSMQKVPFFIQKVSKNQKFFLRKRSVVDNNRLVTQ